VDIPQPPPAARVAIDTLIRLDPDFAGILDRAGPLPWRRRTPGFPALLQAIVAQMISNQAAAAIWSRLRAIPGALDPATMIELPDEALRGAGLSRPKVVHSRALATAFLDGTLSADRIALLDDEAAIVTIGSIKGLDAGRQKSICCSRWSGWMCFRPATSHWPQRWRT
jgi:DNA-3-methyladenine glycosylase II